MNQRRDVFLGIAIACAIGAWAWSRVHPPPHVAEPARPPAVDAGVAPGDAGRACPPGGITDPSRLARLEAKLREADVAPPTDALVCFDELDVPVVHVGGVIVLDRRAPDAESAARLAHLALHVAEGTGPLGGFHPNEPCEAQVDRALDGEARAFATELAVRERLGVTSERYPFEHDTRAAAASERVGLIRAWLAAHPDGGPGVDALARGYAAQCEAAR